MARRSRRSGCLQLSSLLFIGVIAIFLVGSELANLIPNFFTPLERMESGTRDLFMRLRGTQSPTVPIAIVAIDDASFNYTGYRWPWPRAYLAQIVDVLNRAGAKVVCLDVFLFEADADPAGDQALAKAFAGARASCVLAHISRSAGAETLNTPIKPYQNSFSALGLAGVLNDEDAVVRSVQVYDYSGYNNRYYFNWSLEAARLYLGAPPPEVRSSDQVLFNGGLLPVFKQRLLINYLGPAKTFAPYYSAHQVALGDYPPEKFRDKIVLIGATTDTLQDLYPTPFSTTERTPGVEIVANAIHTLVSQQYIYEASVYTNALLILLAALAAALIVSSYQPTRAVVLMFVSMVVYAVAWAIAYLVARWQFTFVAFEAMLLLGVVVPMLEQVFAQELEKRRVRNLFGRFISPEMVDQLLKTENINKLNKRARLTILFSDIRNFTTISEKLTPEGVVNLLNPYLMEMTEVIHKYGGTVDKYEGDAIIAFFGEPIPYKNHALRAVRAACEMRLVLSRLREKWEVEHNLPGAFEIGIGIHTGEVFVGLIGSEHRVNYTVIGDAVNMSSRLQDQTKDYNWPILISRETKEEVDEEFDTDLVARVLLKGKREPVEIYRVLGAKGAPESERIYPLIVDEPTLAVIKR